jgi:hypothetical protein
MIGGKSTERVALCGCEVVGCRRFITGSLVAGAALTAGAAAGKLGRRVLRRFRRRPSRLNAFRLRRSVNARRLLRTAGRYEFARVCDRSSIYT